ncbi:MAG TPA: ADOP family duplicated permease [Gemmatimonadaceae bacterium]|nr:ADOP family duplicated permease [Gemmatimonadaceae bacterium]
MNLPSWLKHALRSLKRTPVFTTTATLTLVLGLGSVAAMFAIVYGVLLAPLPFGHSDRLVSVGMDARSPELRRIQQPAGAYFAFKRFSRRLQDIGFYRTGNANIWTRGSDDQAERVTATWVTTSTLSMLQVPPLLGRASFTVDEDRGHGPDAAIISESVWRQRFHADRDVIGKILYANSVARIIVGVMPERFRFPDAATRVWLPSKLDRAGASLGDFSYSAVGRLVDGATTAVAQRDLATVLPRVVELFPLLESGTPTITWLDQTGVTPVVTPLRDEMTSGIARTLWILAAAAGLVLLVACANVTNLMLIRADGRQLELAVREALGASRLRILTHFLGEAVVLCAAAGAIAVAAAWVAVSALVSFGPADVPRLAELHVGSVTTVFVVVVAIASACLCSIVPAFRIRRANLSISLRDGGRSDTASKARQRLRMGIAATQIAVALVVLAGSALLLRTFRRLYDERPGFDTRNVITVWMQLPFARYSDSGAVRFHARLTAAVRDLPNVRAAGLTERLPLGDGETHQQSFRMEEEGRQSSLSTNAIDDGYFAAMNIPLLAGRSFQTLSVQRDGEAVISRRAAETLWHDPTGRAAVGRRIVSVPAGPSYTIIGVAGDVRDRDLGAQPSATLYVPQVVPLDSVEPRARRMMALVVKTSGSPTAVLPSIRKIVRDLDPTVPIFNVELMTDVVRASMARLSFALTLMSAAAIITLLLGAIGLYGVMAYMVALRTREFGVRIALGADPRQLAQTVAMRGLALVVIGAGAGLVLFAVVAPLLRSLLYGVSPTDPLTLGGAVLALVVTASIAAWLPARRAARVDPAEALRAD